MKSILFLSLFLILAANAPAKTEEGKEEALSLLPGELTYPVVSDEKGIMAADVPFRSAGGSADLAKWKARVLSVSVDNKTRPEIAGAGKASVLHDPSSGLRLHLTFSGLKPELFRAGAYAVNVEVTPAGEPPAPEILTLNLFREQDPVPKVVPPATYVVEQIVGFGGSKEDICPPLTIREMEGKAGIPELKIEDVSQHGDVKKITKARLSAATMPLPAGQGIDIPVSTTEPFPLGETTGKLALSGKGLPTPIELNYTVRAHRHPIYIWVFAALGLVAGAALRTWPKLRAEKLASCDAIEETLLHVEEARLRYHDEKFRKQLDDLETKLKNALEAGPADAKTANDEVVTALGPLVLEHHTRIFRLREELAELQKIVGRSWVLPRTLREALGNAVDLVKIETMLAEGNAADAEKALKDRREELVAVLGEPGRKWRTRLGDLLDELAADRAPIPLRAAGLLTTAVKDFKDASAVATPALSPDNAGLEAFLLALHQANLNARDLLDRAAGWLRTDYQEVSRKLQAKPVAKTAGEALAAAAATLTDGLAGAAEAPAEAQQQLAGRLAEIGAIFDGLPALAPETVRPKVEEKLAAREYTAAVALLGERILGDTVAAAAVPPPPPWVYTSFSPGGAGAGSSLVVPPTIVPILERRRRTKRSLGWIHVLQTLVTSAVVVTALSFNLVDSFTGTARELAGIVLGAFLFDFSAGKMLEPSKFKEE